MRTLKPKTNKQLAVIRSSCFYILMPAHRAHALLSPSPSPPLSLPPILPLPLQSPIPVTFRVVECQLTSSTNFLSDLRGTELLNSPLPVFAFPFHPSANLPTFSTLHHPLKTHERDSNIRESRRGSRSAEPLFIKRRVRRAVKKDFEAVAVTGYRRSGSGRSFSRKIVEG